MTPRDSVLFGCYRGEFANDSQLALDHALARQRPELTRYWGVADTSTVVPEGSVPLIIGSVEWYDALGASRFLCNNIDFGPYFRRVRTRATCRPSTATRSSRWGSTSGAARASPTRRCSDPSTGPTASGTRC